MTIAPHDPAPSILAGRYRLDSELGRGGMGVVFRARDLQLDRDVAIKLLGGNRLDTRGRERLLREARVAAGLNHPHVVAVYDVGEHAGAPYVVMELVRGRTLADATNLDLSEVLPLLVQLCDALEHAHEHGLVHRDLKPDNILLAGSGDRRTVKLADLGVAISIQNRQVTEDGAIAGTVSYMAPEQALGRRVDKRADLYSLGVVLYERATGRLPFEGLNPVAVLSQHIHAPVVPPRTHAPRLAPALEAIILKLMSKDPEARYSSAREVGAALGSVLAAGPGEAGRVAERAEGERRDDEGDTIHLDPPGAGGAIGGRGPHGGASDRTATEGAGREPTGARAPAADTRSAGESLSSADRLVLGLGGLIRGRLVGRERELGELRALWKSARESRGQLALITGEPGAGKTRLAREIAVIARIDGAPVISGGCYEYEATTPYLPFVEAIRSWVHAEADDAALAEILGDSAAEIARLAPELDSRLGPFPAPPPLPQHEERLRLFDHVARFFSALAAQRGAIVGLDDLHWADEGTIALLGYLRRQLKDEPILLLGTYREVELDRSRPLARALVDWNRERLVARIQLQRLTRDETGTLLATLLGQDSVPAELTRAVFRETDGNAFFIEEVMKSLVEQGGIQRKGTTWVVADVRHLDIPQSVKTAIGARLDRATETCVETLRTAAVIGKDFSFDDLVAVSGADEDALLDALDEATAHQLILPGSGDMFVFTHDKIREVLYEEMNPIRRRRLHTKVGQGLLARFERQGPGGSPAQETGARSRRGLVRSISHADLAFHFIEAGEHEAALEHSGAAAEEAAAVFALDTAIEQYANALESALALGQEDRVVQLEKKLAETCERNGRATDATRYGESALGRGRLARAERLDLTLTVAAGYVVVGNPRGRELVTALLEEVDPVTESDLRCVGLLINGRYEHLDGRYRRAIALYEEALQTGTGTSPGFLGACYSYLAGAYQHLAEVPRSVEWATRCVEHGRSIGDLHSVCLGLEFLGEDSAGLGLYGEGIRHAEEEIEIATRIQARERVAWALFIRGFCLVALGELDAGLTALREGVDLADAIEERRLQVLCEDTIAVTLAAVGDPRLAAETLAVAERRARGLGLTYLISHATEARAELHRMQRRWPEMLAAAEDLGRILQGTEERWHSLFCGHLHIQALIELGRLDEAEAAIEDALALADTATARALGARVTALRGRLRAERGDATAGLADLRTGIEGLEALGAVVPAAVLRADRGRILDRLGRADEAARELETARTALDRAGAAGEAAALQLP